MSERKLPALQDLYKGDVALIDQENKLNVLLNQPPKEEWVKRHPFAKGVDKQPIAHLPIERVEYLLTAVFINWSVEVKNIMLMANSVVVTIRLHYQDPVTQQMRFHDGIGAAPIQTDQGAGATDFNKVKSDGVMKGAPAAESFAVKDAAHKLGRLFGKDLNRRDDISYDSLTKKFDMTAKLKKILSEQIGTCQDPEVVSAAMDEVLKAEEEGTNTQDFYVALLKKHFSYDFDNA